MKWRGWLISITVLAILLIPAVEGENGEEQDYISYPGNIPLFHDFDTPQIVPGDDETMSVSLRNRYDWNITNVIFTIEIYRYANIEEWKNLSDTMRPPTFVGTGNFSETKSWEGIGPNETVTDASFRIDTNFLTERGTYFIRLELTFDYNGSSYVMRSRGHFTDEQWDHATNTSNEDDPGGINITALGVDGIIPDTTFGVHKADSYSLDDLTPGFELTFLLGASGVGGVLRAKRKRLN